MTRVLEDWIEFLKDLGSNLEKKKPSPDGFEPLTSGHTTQRSTTCAVCQRSQHCLSRRPGNAYLNSEGESIIYGG